MIQAKNQKERFADYINKMTFSEVIEFFNFMMEDMMQIENHAMFDWTIQEDAEKILKEIGVGAFAGMLNGQYEERAVLCSVNQKGELNYEWGLNPWTEILDGYSEWIISHIEDCMNGEKDAASINLKYPALFDVVREPKEKFKFILDVEVEDFDAESARMRLDILCQQLDIESEGLQITKICRLME